MGILFSARARNTPTWAMPRAAPPERASPIFGGDEGILILTDPIGLRGPIRRSALQFQLFLGRCREKHRCQIQSSLPSNSARSQRGLVRASERCDPENASEIAAYKPARNSPQPLSGLLLRNF